MTSFSGGLADVGESRCNYPPKVKSYCFRKVVSRISDDGCIRVLWGKVRKPMQYKLIMVSRVPGYGHLEYLVLGLSC